MAFQQMIDAKQIQLIHIARAQLGLPVNEYREIIAAQTKGKKTSSKDLTYFEADAVINYFVKTLGFKIKSNYIRTAGAARRQRWAHANSRKNKNPPVSPFMKGGMNNVVMLPSPDQMEMIKALVNKIAWKFEDGYERWRQKYMKIDRIKTEQEASKVIEGLKGLLAHQIDGDDQCKNG